MAQATDYVEGIPKPGEEIAGKYRVERLIGAGGMGAVVAATHLGLGQQVAVKFLLAEAALNPNSISRFEREARAAAKIQSDHVAKVHDVGKLDNGTPYMVMEFLQGEDLSETLERGRLPLQAAVRCVLEAAEALSEAHKLGIVHRDLKPANLFLARRPDGTARVKVLDFGISKDTGLAGGAQLTRTSALMGSPVYMAPEQMESAKYVDARSDIWALGTILYEALTGVLPFNGDTLPEICAKILQAEPPSLKTVLPEAPPGLEEVIGRALQKRPDARFQSLAEFSAALVPFGDADAPRSVAVIHRVLGATPPAQFSPRTGSVDLPSGPGAPAPPTSPVGAPSIAQAPMFHQGTGPAGYPAAQQGAGATMPGAYGASAAGGQPIPATAMAGAAPFGQQTGTATSPSGVAPVGMAPVGPGGVVTGPGVITSPGAVPGAAGAVTGPGVITSPGAVPVGHMPPTLGTSTAAPFSQTMGERRARSSHGGLIAAVVVAGLAVGGVATVALMMTGGGETDPTAASGGSTSEPAGEAPAEPSGEPTAVPSDDSAEPAGEGGGPAEPAASAEPSAVASAEPEPTAAATRPGGAGTRPPKTPTTTPAPTPKSTTPVVPTRKGADLF